MSQTRNINVVGTSGFGKTTVATGISSSDKPTQIEALLRQLAQ